MAGLVLGVIGAVAVPGAAVAGTAIGAFFGTLAAIRARPTSTDDPGLARAARRAGFVVAGLTGSGCAVLAGVVPQLGPVGGVAMLIALALALAVRWLRRGRRHPTGGVDGRPAAMPGDLPGMAAQPLPDRLESLSTQELCLAWRRSYVALLDLEPGSTLFKIVRMRASLLNELERRDQGRFAHWLGEDCLAGSDPTPYLAPDR